MQAREKEFLGLQEKLAKLTQEHKELNAQFKKQGRVLDNLNRQIQRSRELDVAKDNFSKVIANKRSQLERYMNLLLDNCPDIILIFDRDSRIVYCTQSFLQLCNLPALGMIAGKHYDELLSGYATPRFVERWEAAISHAFTNKQATEFGEEVDFQRCGIPRNYNVQITPMMGENDKVEGSMAFFHDTTEITAAQREAERANAAKSDFLATISHEIRTPLNAIIGVLAMLKDTELSEGQSEHVNIIHSSSNVLLGLINDILDFSKIEANKLELIEGYFDLSVFLSNLRLMFEFLFEEKELEFVCNFAPDLPQVILADEIRLSQILANILSNALKYTQKGKVTFSVGVYEGSSIRFGVTDTGPGLRKEAIPMLFTAFEQFDLVKNKNITGTGLGLAITKRLCEMMKGEITVDSVYGVGSTFAAIIPLRAGEIENLPAKYWEESVGFTAPGARVLLVDDIEINLQIAAYMLEGFGVCSDLAYSGKEAIEKVKAADYDIIFMDHMMPEMDGIEATQIIRGLPGKAGKTPVVALTANAVNSAEQTFLQSGFNAVLPKPITEVALARCLLQYLPGEKVVSEASES
ncbi:MAG: ATP-binding protein [Oscillospiraceae bacterium]|nr:ATP-binding protein [Oscillospiraceae bacterium]